MRAETQYALEEMAVWLAEASDEAGPSDRAHYRLLGSDIGRFLERPHEVIAMPGSPSMPPGSPIGQPDADWLRTDRWTLPTAWSGTGGWIDLSCSWR